jgi:hypothetical protein
MASQVTDTAWLARIARLMGGASRQSCAATFPPNRFYCLLDELPLHLIPRWVGESFEKVREEELFLNPECRIGHGEQLPADLGFETELLTGFAPRGTVAWVRDPATLSLLPFWLGPKLEAVVSKLPPGHSASDRLPEDARFLLAAAGILTSEDRAEQRIGEYQNVVRNAAPAFSKKGYVPLRNLIHPFHLAALRRYYRCLIRRGDLHLGDNSSSRRYVAHNERVAGFFHHQMAKTVSAIVGEAIKPSYVYLASYMSGAELQKHTDREQCEFSVTLCLDFSPEPVLETSWPIRLDTPQGTVAVYQALGDGLLYRGTQVPHYRDALGQGRTSTSIFFHYVPADFVGPLS